MTPGGTRVKKQKNKNGMSGDYDAEDNDRVIGGPGGNKKVGARIPLNGHDDDDSQYGHGQSEGDVGSPGVIRT